MAGPRDLQNRNIVTDVGKTYGYQVKGGGVKDKLGD